MSLLLASGAVAFATVTDRSSVQCRRDRETSLLLVRQGLPSGSRLQCYAGEVELGLERIPVGYIAVLVTRIDHASFITSKLVAEHILDDLSLKLTVET